MHSSNSCYNWVNMSSWQQQDFAKDYADSAADIQKNWFEHDLNFPLLLQMLPKDTQRILDYGCGPGEFTAELAKHFTKVDGCDYSGKMIQLAKANYQNCNFFVWNNLDTTPPVEPYDAIFSKLTLQFVDDLTRLANSFKPILKSGGMFVFSVPHPLSTIKKVSDYWSKVPYETDIGSYGLKTTMIHRSLQDYLLPFLDNGYSLVGIVEPKISQEQAVKHNEPTEKLIYPRRINLGFKKL